MKSQPTSRSPERDRPEDSPPTRPRSPERDRPEDSPPTRPRSPERDRPWIMRTYSGHSSAAASNLLYRANLEKGQTGLSVAFDLPTQTGYDSDHELARGEVGKVGVPICSIDDMRALFEGIPLAATNTSMTINATAMWLLALYIAAAEEQGANPGGLVGTTQNDVLKEYLSRGTYAFPPEPSMRLTADLIAYTVAHVPRWNPVNISSYHLQEAGATPVQEIAFALANATAVLDAVRGRGQIEAQAFDEVVGRVSFFVNAGIRFVEETAKMRAFVQLWDRLTRERYGVRDPKLRRFRYGVQVNSLGLTEQQPENNIARILLEMLGVTLSKQARARAVQLPAWNEALGLPRPWDQQLSLRMQQVLAYETDLLEYDDLFDGAPAVDAKTTEIAEAAWEELRHVIDLGGALAAVEYMKSELVRSNAKRLRRIESREQVVVGVNAFTQAEPSPLTTGVDAGFLKIDESAELRQIERLEDWRERRDGARVARVLERLRREAEAGGNLVPASIEAAKAGVTTGEWAGVLRDLYGDFRAPTGVSPRVTGEGHGPLATRLAEARGQVRAIERRLGRRLKLLVGKPGLDGHSNGAEQVAVMARDLGMEVVYEGIRLTPSHIVRTAVDEDVHVVGLSVLSGSHLSLVAKVIEGLRAEGHEALVVVGGIIPTEDVAVLRDQGVAAVYTPKDYELTRMLVEIAELVAARVAAP